MSNNHESDVKKAADKVNTDELKDNLKGNDNEANKPEDLDKDEKTPFIKDDLRTD